MALDVIERADNVRDAVLFRSRISVTELSRGRAWRAQLADAGVIEITDRGDTAGWLVSDADMTAIMEGYARLEEELEQAQIAALFAARGEGEPKTGSELAQAALAAFDTRADELEQIVTGAADGGR